MDPVAIKCYVCNNETDDWRSNLIGLKSQHSETLISEFIKKILGDFKSLRNIDDETNCICEDCVNKIEEYDRTCMLAKRCESELYEILVQTETSCLNDENETKMVGDMDGADMKDGQSFDDTLLVDALTPLIQLNVEEVEPQIPTTNDSCDKILISENVDDYEVKRLYDSDFVGKREASFGEEEEGEKGEGFNDDDAPEKRSTIIEKPSTERRRPTTEPNEQMKSHSKLHPEGIEQSKVLILRCKLCSHVSNDQELFDTHAKLHQDINPLQCVFCDKIFINAPGLRLHVRTVHETAHDYICHICGKQCNKKMSLRNHMRYHSNIRNFKCPQCSMTFIHKSNFSRHLTTHTKIKPYSCSICNRKFAHKYNVKPHEKTHTDLDVYKKFKCSFCESGFDSKNKLYQHHSKSHSMIAPHLENTNDLAKGEINETAVQKEHSCLNNEEVEMNKNSEQITEHGQELRLHPKQEKRTWECYECKIAFEKRIELKIHNRCHRIRPLAPKFRCKICFYISHDQSAFDAHAKLHENTDPLQCLFCNKIFSYKRGIQFHVGIVHQKTRNHECNICGKKFVQSSNLNSHMKYHLNIRNFKCSHCSMSFVNKTSFTRHLTTHTKLKPYSCSICDRKFAHKYNVKPHEKNHTNPNVYKKFKCNFCVYGFNAKRDLKQHQKQCHLTPHFVNMNDLSNETR